MTIEEAKSRLYALQSKMSAYNHALGLLSYDGSTTAPSGTAANRGHSMSILSEEVYKLSTCSDTFELLEFLDANKAELSGKEQRMVFLLLKDLRTMSKIPMEEYIAYQELLVEADDAWHKAKPASDFASFEPLLEKIFETNIRFAKYCAPDMDPYDYWLNEYEEGLNKQVCDEFFSLLRSRLVPLIKAAGEKEQVSDACVKGFFPQAKQHELSLALMKIMGLDMEHVGISTTEHPFTTTLGSRMDVRITTNYREQDYSGSMYSVIHEGGHALYNSGTAEDLAFTVLDAGISMGIHESQSRFYENILGRSRAFCSYIFPKIQEIFPELSAYTSEDFYRAVNRTEPSLIRTEADEVTYSLHVMVRYELEKKIMAGELKVHDLPAEWNRLYKEYLGVDVPDDRRGVLQDTHWAGGMIGYFPSYALGSAYGAQFLSRMKESIDVDACVSEGNFAPINAWNRGQIWFHGNTKSPSQLIKDVCGKEFDPEYYIEYLEGKCREIYGL